METILATAFGRQVNVLKGEGDQLIEAAARLFLNVNNLLIWMECIYCMNFIIVVLFIMYFSSITNFLYCYWIDGSIFEVDFRYAEIIQYFFTINSS